MQSSKHTFSLAIHRTTLLALAFGASACDVEDQDLLDPDDVLAEAEADAELESEAEADASGAMVPHSAGLTDAPNPGAAPLPIFTIAPPIHAEDLAHNHYMQINRDAQGDSWHDIVITRFDDDSQTWTNQREGTSSEQEALGWDIPIYSGVAGEVISCWRNAPYHAEPQWGLEQIGGNFMIIRTEDDRYVYYAHMQTDGIPAELCPNESATGWYNNAYVLRAGSNIPAESYVEEHERAQISVGQHIGRMGAHGNAAGPHLHVHAGNVTSNANGVLSTGSVAYEMDFSDIWYQTRDSLPNGTNPWTFAASGVLPALAQANSLRIWPSYKHEATFSDAPHLGEFNQSSGGVQDLLCHDAGTGGQWLDYGDVSGLNGTNWNGSTLDFCSARTQRLHKGDFDGDGRQDLLCHDLDGGQRWVRYANTSGNFDNVTTYTDPNGWCELERQKLHVGDFNGDGRDDLLCHNTIAGQRYIDYSAPFSAGNVRQMPFAGTDLSRLVAWCWNYFQRLHIGDFDGEGTDDLLCHDTRSGALWLDYASGATVFDGTDYHLANALWCDDGGEHMIVGEFTADARDDLLCHDADNGDLEIRAAQGNATRFLTSSTWKRDATGWCTAPYQRLRVGDIGGDGRDDLLCHDQKSGYRWADHMTAITGLSTGGFQGSDWVSASGWCNGTGQGLH